MLMRHIKCPFCGRRSVLPGHLNVLCPCGAKYYIHNGEFWDRNNGEVVTLVEHRLFDDPEYENRMDRYLKEKENGNGSSNT